MRQIPAQPRATSALGIFRELSRDFEISICAVRFSSGVIQLSFLSAAVPRIYFISGISRARLQVCNVYWLAVNRTAGREAILMSWQNPGVKCLPSTCMCDSYPMLLTLFIRIDWNGSPSLLQDHARMCLKRMCNMQCSHVSDFLEAITGLTLRC